MSLKSEQHGQLGIVGDGQSSLRDQALDAVLDGSSVRNVAQHPGERTQNERDDERCRQRRNDPPPIPAQLLCLSVNHPTAFRQKAGFVGSDQGRVRSGPLLDSFEPAPSEQELLGPAGCDPVGSRKLDAPGDQQVLSHLADPGGEPGPPMDQSFVGEFDRRLVSGRIPTTDYEPVADESLHQRMHGGPI